MFALTCKALTVTADVFAVLYRLESMLGLSGCTLLEELYLSHNGIWKIEGLETLINLKVREEGKVQTCLLQKGNTPLVMCAPP